MQLVGALEEIYISTYNFTITTGIWVVQDCISTEDGWAIWGCKCTVGSSNIRGNMKFLLKQKLYQQNNP